MFGPDNPPATIVMTYARFDYAGGLADLLEAWPDVPVYAHELELPDPTVGGELMAYLSFVYPKHP